MAETVLVYELRKREDGSVYGLGNSLEVSKDEAVKLVRAGSHAIDGLAIGECSGKKKSGVAVEDAAVNGNYSDRSK